MSVFQRVLPKLQSLGAKLTVVNKLNATIMEKQGDDIDYFWSKRLTEPTGIQTSDRPSAGPHSRCSPEHPHVQVARLQTPGEGGLAAGRLFPVRGAALVPIQ